MLTLAIDPIDIFQRGGPVMWPLLILSIASVAMTLERAWFWLRTHPVGWRNRTDNAISALRSAGRFDLSITFYRRAIIAAQDLPADETIALELVERHRSTLDRFANAYAAIIAAAPLLGILGTVLGIIQAFDLLGQGDRVRDIAAVAASIAEALITTGAGLTVALIALLPAAIFRANANNAQGTLERIAAARLAQTHANPRNQQISGESKQPAG